MSLVKKLTIIIFIFLNINNLYAEVPYILNFKYILNESEAGKKRRIF